jgi:hypothetical protein
MSCPKKPKGMAGDRYRDLIRENKIGKRAQAYILRQQKLKYREIGELLDPPVSVERVRQLVHAHERFLRYWNALRETV